ncbi:MAG: glycosyltransferase family 4 protein [Pseudomonadota bacterium]
MTKPNVLIIAEAANPEWVSVPLVGWSLATALQRATGGHIVTQIRNKDAFLRAGMVEGEDFTAIDSEAVASPFYKASTLLRGGAGKGWTTNTAIDALAYPYFEHLIWKQFGDDIKKGAYDIVHRITPLSPTIASPIAKKCARHGVKFVMGPMNGGIPWPSGFDAERRREKEWLSYVRNAYKLLPGRMGMVKAASAIVAGSQHTRGEYPDAYKDKYFYIPENAIDPERFSLCREYNDNDEVPLRVCFIGRMVPYKGPDMLLEAATPLLKAGKLHIDMIGDGPLMPDLRAMIEGTTAEDAVTFHGWQDHKKVQEIAVVSSLLAFPSVREFGGGVVLEAMALGVVPLIVDYGGPGELVSEKTGYKVPIGSREDIVAQFGAMLSALAGDPSALPDMGKAARRHVFDKLTWDKKAEQIIDIYEWTLDREKEKPQAF